MSEPPQPKKNLLRYLRWRDFAVVVVGLAIGWWIKAHIWHEPTDYQKWQARPELRLLEELAPPTKTKDGAICFFIVPKGATDEPETTGEVGNCLVLVPDGKRLDLFEVSMFGGVVHIMTDLFVRDILPLAFTRCTVPLDDWARRNEVFLPNVYDLFMWGTRLPYTEMTWRLPDGQLIDYQRVSPGTGFVDAIFEAVSTREGFERSRVNWNGWGWDLSREDGMTYLSPEAYNATRVQQGSIVGIFDGQGHEVRVARKSSGMLTEIDGPGGGWIKLKYTGSKISRARSSAGGSVEYLYDAEDRLVTAQYSDGSVGAANSVTKYSYDSLNRLVGVDEGSAGSLVKIHYDSNGRVEAMQVDGGVYRFRHLAGEVDVMTPAGQIKRFIVANNVGD